ncbi:type VI secretion system contractile sheath large subunit [Vibrio sp. SCSIO 43136]|uniref:type VI secretion system contractile sheath large subunit n=1 Tax=Vibrio sp. SCSIO 43136 TaxID=2819101 RepID=UPI002075C532|nr:type VI secretion system contractile sheath large subunit [Vibrio sp. SCSIO 43136]USD67513.1 type VI secretion system contractile sheath large subunit [Vibrio sp. SCSIO 43136]
MAVSVEEILAVDDPLVAVQGWEQPVGDKDLCRQVDALKALLTRAICNVELRLNAQVNEILHHPKFQKLEASWRGVKYVCDQAALNRGSSVNKVKLISFSWNELCRDMTKAIEFDHSQLFRVMYDAEFNTPGGEPFGIMIGDYEISHKSRSGQQNDIEVLRSVSHCAAAAFCPFIVGAAPSLFGVDHYSELASVQDIGAQFSQNEYVLWNRLRRQEDARFLGIMAPNMLMRTPYLSDGTRCDQFGFREAITCRESDYLWGNAAYGFAAVALRAYRESGWFSQIRGLQPGKYKHGLIFDLPSCTYRLSRKSKNAKPSVNLQVTDRLEKQLSNCGFIPVTTVPLSENLVLYSNTSVYQPRTYSSQVATVNSRLSSLLQYVLCVSRFAHYLKVIGRERIGVFDSAAAIERDLQSWLHKYTTASDDASDEVRARYPLCEANIEVKERQDKPGYFYSVIHLQPYFQLDQMVSSIRLTTELSPRIK